MPARTALLIVNDAPYGSERMYNALRLAHALKKGTSAIEVAVFLMADAVTAAKAGQKPPPGYYNIELMLKRVLSGGGEILLCGTCMDARGVDEGALIAGTRRSSMDELAAATAQADRVLVF
ncbi:MAG TPA: DsrE family protein [Pseudolabrys sp.]|nr:DsrE family protein [Pseudolabrys sp.]